VRNSGKTPAPLPEAKQTELDSIQALLDKLKNQELKNVTIKAKKFSKSRKLNLTKSDRLELPK
jgi:hypothetical protein